MKGDYIRYHLFITISVFRRPPYAVKDELMVVIWPRACGGLL